MKQAVIERASTQCMYSFAAANKLKGTGATEYFHGVDADRTICVFP